VHFGAQPRRQPRLSAIGGVRPARRPKDGRLASFSWADFAADDYTATFEEPFYVAGHLSATRTYNAWFDSADRALSIVEAGKFFDREGHVTGTNLFTLYMLLTEAKDGVELIRMTEGRHGSQKVVLDCAFGS
jgi:hypothetical protein